MKILRHRLFEKKYQKLNSSRKKQIDDAIKLFEKNPFSIKLNNHSLKGKFQGLASINAGFDLRIIYKQENSFSIVIFITLGNHNNLYR
ncbi:MAG: type II toxin-antitoxin system mRNA interferase toxin, RelE/StbE family [Candidatus Gracilibacteria bacterium]|jgi:addiction module RelE/StbE family toxin|nr:type II toxin-antitoxin system mRNA interferase toxin, RelE/StbE family [Candidatus Gracilibacteria bacterium]